MQLKKLFAAHFSGAGIAVVSGMLLTLAFAPFNLFPLAVISPALLLCLWLDISPGRAFFRGWLFGLGFFGSGVYWIYNSIHVYGNASVFLSTFITVGLVNILAVFPALTGFFLNRYFPKTNLTKIICAFPAIWTFLEWVRSWIFTGFPWLSLGYSQVHTPLKGYAPCVGIYGVTLITLITSGLFVAAILSPPSKNKKSIVYGCLSAIVILWAIGAGISFIYWTKPQGQPIQVSLIQGNIPQELKWSPEEVQPTLDLYEKLTNEHWDSKIIVWPEGAIPMTLQQSLEFVIKMSTQARDHNATLITGIPIKRPNTETGYYNAVIGLGDGGGAYVKHRLVPFGEYIPFEKYLTRLLGSLDIPMSDFVPGARTAWQPLFAHGTKISVYICYEIAFPELVRAQDPKIGLILTVSNDGWFGHSIAQAQHLQIAEMRALEMRRPVLFVGNDGPTGIINAYGNIQSRIPPFETGVLTDKVQPRQGKTMWQVLSMDPVLLTLLLLVLIAVRGRGQKF
jgi:apolipoprotein N-acyltransferase